MKHWWKILGVLLMIYSIVAGLAIPLKPGIYDASPSKANTGEVFEINAVGYLTQFDNVKNNTRAWLKVDNEHAIAATSFQTTSLNESKISFNIPDNLPTKDRVVDATLIIDSQVDGSLVFPSAVFITNTSGNTSAQGWNNEIKEMNAYANMAFPYRNILQETIRNLFYHVPLWFGMMIIFLISTINSIRYLMTKEQRFDHKASAYASVGTLFGILGLVTGAIWAKHTWGAYWSWDIKQNMSAIAMLIYLAYFVLRNSFEESEQSARISAVYNIFAFVTLPMLLFVIPRLMDSLHPGSGGNPGFGGDDLDNNMRMVFYPAIIGFTLFGAWMATILYRIEGVKQRLLDRAFDR